MLKATTTIRYKILVTGGAGFLGSHIADALSAAGHEVIIFDIKSSPYRQESQKLLVGSILDRATLEQAIAGCDFVFHLGAIADIDVAEKHPYETMEVNVLGTINVLEAARQHKLQRVIFASSVYVYSRAGSFYRISKHACELLLEEYKKHFNLDFTTLRFGTLYGPRSDSHNSVYRYLQQALELRRINFNGTGEEVREYIHVEDAAKICVEILKGEYNCQNYIITGNHRIRVLDLLQMIKEILGNDVNIIHNNQHIQSHYLQTPYSYQARIGKLISSKQSRDLSQILLDMIEEIALETSAPLSL